MQKGVNLNQRTGQRIRTVRNILGLSQSDLGECLNVSYQQIQKYESGKNNITLQRLNEIANLFGIPANALISDDYEVAEVLGDPVKAQILSTLRSLNAIRDTTLVKNEASEEEMFNLIKEFGCIEDKTLRDSLYKLIKLLGE